MADWVGGLAQAGANYFSGRLQGETTSDARRRQMAQEALDAERIRQIMQLAAAAESRAAEAHPLTMEDLDLRNQLTEETMPTATYAREAEQANVANQAANVFAGQAAAHDPYTQAIMAQQTGVAVPSMIAPAQMPAVGPEVIPGAAAPTMAASPLSQAQMPVLPGQAGEPVYFTAPAQMGSQVAGGPVSSFATPTMPVGEMRQGTGVPVSPEDVAARWQELSPADHISVGRRAGASVTANRYGQPVIDFVSQQEAQSAAVEAQKTTYALMQAQADVDKTIAASGLDIAHADNYDLQSLAQSIANEKERMGLPYEPVLIQAAVSTAVADATIKQVAAQVAVLTKDPQIEQVLYEAALAQAKVAIEQNVARTWSQPTTRSESTSRSFSQNYSQSSSMSDYGPNRMMLEQANLERLIMNAANQLGIDEGTLQVAMERARAATMNAETYQQRMNAEWGTGQPPQAGTDGDPLPATPQEGQQQVQ